MTSPSDDLARRAAQRLTPEIGPNLAAAVEAQLQGAKPPERYEPFSIAIALASLIVTAAKTAWDIYQDIQKSTEQKGVVDSASIKRRLRLTLKIDANVPPELRAKAIDVVVDELPATS